MDLTSLITQAWMQKRKKSLYLFNDVVQMCLESLYY